MTKEFKTALIVIGSIAVIILIRDITLKQQSIQSVNEYNQNKITIQKFKDSFFRKENKFIELKEIAINECCQSLKNVELKTYKSENEEILDQLKYLIQFKSDSISKQKDNWLYNSDNTLVIELTKGLPATLNLKSYLLSLNEHETPYGVVKPNFTILKDTLKGFIETTNLLKNAQYLVLLNKIKHKSPEFPGDGTFISGIDLYNLEIFDINSRKRIETKQLLVTNTDKQFRDPIQVIFDLERNKYKTFKTYFF